MTRVVDQVTATFKTQHGHANGNVGTLVANGSFLQCHRPEAGTLTNSKAGDAIGLVKDVHAFSNLLRHRWRLRIRRGSQRQHRQSSRHHSQRQDLSTPQSSPAASGADLSAAGPCKIQRNTETNCSGQSLPRRAGVEAWTFDSSTCIRQYQPSRKPGIQE